MSYSLLPFQFRRTATNRLLVVSLVGECLSVSDAEFRDLIDDRLDPRSALGVDLQSRQIIAPGETGAAIELLATKLRTRKAYLADFTSLHMVVLTTACNGACSYCHMGSDAPGVGGSMSPGTASAVVDRVFDSPAPRLKIEFQGGEPTLNWPVLCQIVEDAERRARTRGKAVDFVVCSNLIRLRDEALPFFKEHRVAVSTSLDGPAHLHDAQRTVRAGGSAYAAFRKNLERVRAQLGQDACHPLLTVTRDSLSSLRAIVDEYIDLGFPGVFIRDLNPFGRARKGWAALGYTGAEFVKEYKSALDYILEVNRRGTFFSEYYATLLLSRILTPFSTGFVDLQSPTGAGIAGVIYDWDGCVYPTDEARMLAREGDHSFALGNVNRNTHTEIFLTSRLRSLVRSCCIEALPGCADCAYQLFCGVDPVRNVAECGRVDAQCGGPSCTKTAGILDHLFHLLETADERTTDILWSWVGASARSEAEP